MVIEVQVEKVNSEFGTGNGVFFVLLIFFLKMCLCHPEGPLQHRFLLNQEIQSFVLIF